MGTLTHTTDLLYNPDKFIYIFEPEKNGEATYMGTFTHASNNPETAVPGDLSRQENDKTCMTLC